MCSRSRLAFAAKSLTFKLPPDCHFPGICRRTYTSAVFGFAGEFTAPELARLQRCLPRAVWYRELDGAVRKAEAVPGAHGAHYDALAAPVGATLAFAGEATNRHHPTTAAGAFDSGLREALRFARARGRTHDEGVVTVLAARQARLATARAAEALGGGAHRHQ